MTGIAFYLTTLFVYGAIDSMACMGLNQQYGVAGISNFGYIIFQAAGAYTAAVLALPNSSANGGFQSYIGGFNLPWPIPWIGAAIVGGLVSLPFVFLVGKRLRGDFAAVGLLVAAVLANLLITNYQPFLNGDAGLSLVPAPFSGVVNSQSLSYQIAYAASAVLVAAGVYFFLRRITESPFGRSLRAMRENDTVADSLGKDLRHLRMSMLVLGGMVAGLSGGVLVGFITLWAPSAWTYAETIVIFAAVIIGGAGNHKGAILGAIIVPLGFEEITRFLPQFGPPALIPALEWVAIGSLIIIFLWFRPQGVLPERRRVLGRATKPLETAAGDDADEVTVRQIGVIEDIHLPTVHSNDAPVVNDHRVILSTQGLTKSFDGVTAVSQVSIAIQQGRLTGLIGPNGAGKSTTLALLAGTIVPTSGTITFEDRNITDLPSFKRARSGLVRTFQLASEFKKLTVMENLVCAIPDQPGDSFTGAFKGRRYWGASDIEFIEQAQGMLDAFGLSQYADTYAGALSGGQRRLVEIMRALLAKPSVLLLDEPMAGVHPNLAQKIGTHLTHLCQSGMTIVMVEHELSIMDEFCDPVIVMAEGSVLAQGTMAELRSKSEVVEAYLVG